ncbi:MAG: hydroxymethylglutaryl-CoA lyase [Bacillota bacterium]
MRYPDRVTIVEVGLRDGIQAEPTLIPTERKLAIADAIAAAGVQAMEVTAFVHPAAVPQMADSADLMARLKRRPGVRYAALVPNLKGAERAVAAGVDEIRFVVTASEAFNQRNVQMSVIESIAQVPEIVQLCRAGPQPVRFTGAVGTAFGCPYEGHVNPDRVIGLVAAYVAASADSVILADTTGMGNPLQVARLCAAVQDRFPGLEVTLHLHNTRGMGLVNLLGGLEAGITSFEASLGGTGGCPFAPRATGNICTEDAVHMLHEMGITTDIDLDRLLEAARFMEEAVGHPLPGQVLRAGPRWRPLA